VREVAAGNAARYQPRWVIRDAGCFGSHYRVVVIFGFGPGSPDAQLRHVRTMSGATAAFRAGRLPRDRYMVQAERFWRQLGVNPAGQRPLATPGASVPAQPAAPVRSAAPVPSAPVAAGDQESWILQLQQLAQLQDQGVLSDAAYAAAKRRILERPRQSQPPGPASSPTRPPAS
jgi:hypothetical protein